MIKLNTKKLELDNLFVDNGITRRNGDYYFTMEYLDGNCEIGETLLCVKLSPSNNLGGFVPEVVEVTTKRDTLGTDGGVSLSEEYIIKEEKVKDKELEKDTMFEFFDSLKWITDEKDLEFMEDIVDIIYEYIEDGYFYATENNSSFKNSLCVEFLNIFELKGDVVEGYYEGNVVLTNIKLVNTSTGQIIKEYENCNLSSNLYIEDDDDVDYTLEAYLESMSNEYMKEIFLNIIKR